MIAALLALVAGVAGFAGDEVRVWRPETGQWTAIYRCHRSPQDEDRRLAWAGPVLFIACPGEALARWEVGERAARPVSNQALAQRRPELLGDGARALFFAEAKAVWRYRPELDLLERLGTAPEWPLVALAQTPIGLVVRSARTRWQWRRGMWRLLDSRTAR